MLVCDNTVFVKNLPETAELMRDCSEGYPYDGARANYIPHIENRDLLYKAVTALERITPVPKRRKNDLILKAQISAHIKKIQLLTIIPNADII